MLTVSLIVSIKYILIMHISYLTVGLDKCNSIMLNLNKQNQFAITLSLNFEYL